MLDARSSNKKAEPIWNGLLTMQITVTFKDPEFIVEMLWIDFWSNFSYKYLFWLVFRCDLFHWIVFVFYHVSYSGPTAFVSGSDVSRTYLHYVEHYKFLTNPDSCTWQIARVLPYYYSVKILVKFVQISEWLSFRLWWSLKTTRWRKFLSGY